MYTLTERQKDIIKVYCDDKFEKGDVHSFGRVDVENRVDVVIRIRLKNMPAEDMTLKNIINEVKLKNLELPQIPLCGY